MTYISIYEKNYDSNWKKLWLIIYRSIENATFLACRNQDSNQEYNQVYQSRGLFHFDGRNWWPINSNWFLNNKIMIYNNFHTNSIG